MFRFMFSFNVMLMVMLTIAGQPVVAAAVAAEKEKRAADSAQVDGVFTIPADHADLKGMTLRIILYEYNPFLADAGADKLDQLELTKVAHKKGKATTLKFVVGKDKKTRGDRQYYLSVRGYRGKEYVYYGKPGQGGIGKVLGNGNPVNVAYTGKRMKP